MGVEQASEDAALVHRVRASAARIRRIASICSGAFILAAAGLLHQRRATTYWMHADLLAANFPSIHVDASLIFARDGNIYTSGGITSGIDLALALVEEDVEPEVMPAVARTMVVFPHRPGGQSQFGMHAALLKESDPYKPPIPSITPYQRAEFSNLQAWMFAHPNADLSIAALSDRMGMSPRSFSRRIQKEVGETPAHFVERVRAEAARCKLEQTTSTVERIAVECGVKDPERMRRAFERVYSTTPSEYRGRFRSTLPS